MSVIKQFLNEQIEFIEIPNGKVTKLPISLDELARVVKLLTDATVDICSNKAQVVETIGEDEVDDEGQIFSQKTYHSGGFIKDENFVEVHRESILSVKEIIK